MNATGRRLTAYLAAGVLTVTLAVALVLSAAVRVHDGPVQGATVTQVQPCAEEDSPGPCYWDAGVRGNGVGHSFTVDAAQVVHYDTTGPDWQPVSQELGDALAEGDDAAATTRDWESCRVIEGDTTFVVCPDGYVEVV